MKCLICGSCGIPQRIENPEPGAECKYCGGELLQPEIITESAWRKYWMGVLGQPVGGYRTIKPSIQTVLQKEAKIENNRGGNQTSRPEGVIRSRGRGKNPAYPRQDQEVWTHTRVGDK